MIDVIYLSRTRRSQTKSVGAVSDQ